MPPKQTTTLTSLFAKSVKATATAAAKPNAAANTAKTDVVDVSFEKDADLRAFYASLSPQERIAHSIAVTDLGSSYDVRKTHGFTRWLAVRPK